jgi:hypothetical protein
VGLPGLHRTYCFVGRTLRSEPQGQMIDQG